MTKPKPLRPAQAHAFSVTITSKDNNDPNPKLHIYMDAPPVSDPVLLGKAGSSVTNVVCHAAVVPGSPNIIITFFDSTKMDAKWPSRLNRPQYRQAQLTRQTSNKKGEAYRLTCRFPEKWVAGLVKGARFQRQLKATVRGNFLTTRQWVVSGLQIPAATGAFMENMEQELGAPLVPLCQAVLGISRDLATSGGWIKRGKKLAKSKRSDTLITPMPDLFPETPSVFEASAQPYWEPRPKTVIEELDAALILVNECLDKTKAAGETIELKIEDGHITGEVLSPRKLGVKRDG